jgi:tight adherence protein C
MEILTISILTFFSVFFLIYGFMPGKRAKDKELYGQTEEEQLRTGLLYLLTPFSKKLEIINSKIQGERITRYRKYLTLKLSMSGNPFKLSADEVLSIQEIMFAVFFVFSALIALKAPSDSASGKILFVVMLFGMDILMSMVLPLMILNDAIKQRHKLLTRELPYALDLLTISVEAGLDFIMAMSRVVEKGKSGPLKEEFFIMLQEIKLGKRRREALQDLSFRNNHSDLKTIIASMVQADQIGASLGPILRVQSDLLRKKRMLRAEKIAQEAPVKMLFPLIGFIFPAVFLVLLTPIILKLLHSVKK